MANGNGFQVAPSELTDFASYLETTTADEITKSSQGVTNANKFDFNAFGLFLGQTLGVPSRIAMAVASGELNTLAGKIRQTATDTRTTAQQYAQNEGGVTGTFNSIQGA